MNKLMIHTNFTPSVHAAHVHRHLNGGELTEEMFFMQGRGQQLPMAKHTHKVHDDTLFTLTYYYSYYLYDITDTD